MSRLAKDVSKGIEMTTLQYLELGSGVLVSMFPPGKYEDMFKISGGELYVSSQALICVREKPDSPGCYIYQVVSKDRRYFDEFYDLWSQGSLGWYRGINCSHFNYQNLIDGKLLSEGDLDLPTFTMGSKKTRWLPGCYVHDLCTVPAISNTDVFTAHLADTYHVPLAVVVRVTIGRNVTGVKVAWINSGEQVIQGPIIAPGFSIESIVWMCHRMPQVTNFPPCLSLPPVRPYEPASQEVIDEWWRTAAEQWVDAVNLFGGYHCFLRPKR